MCVDREIRLCVPVCCAYLCVFCMSYCETSIATGAAESQGHSFTSTVMFLVISHCLCIVAFRDNACMLSAFFDPVSGQPLLPHVVAVVIDLACFIYPSTRFVDVLYYRSALV